MRSHRLKLVGAVLGLTMLAAMAFGQSVVRTAGLGRHRAGIGGTLGFFGDYLDLTGAQRTQMKAILAKERPTIQPLIQQLAQGHQQMRQLEEATTFDEAKVRTLATQQSLAATELMVQKARIKSELIQILTADQKTKLATFEGRREARLQKHLERGEVAPVEATPNR
jgi:Spy/CpxP family protein refolding chaperone